MSGHVAYKLVTQCYYTRPRDYGETLWWPVGVTVAPIGAGSGPCTPGVFHGYISPEVAVLGNPAHADYWDPRLLRIASTLPWYTNGLMRWTHGNCTVLEELPLPKLSLDELVAWAIVLAPHTATRAWAVAWLSGDDRSVRSAHVARAIGTSEAESFAACAAERAAWLSTMAAGAPEEVRALPGGQIEDLAARTAKAAALSAALAAQWAGQLVDVKALEDGVLAEWEGRLMAKLARARAILAGDFPAERFDEPVEVTT